MDSSKTSEGYLVSDENSSPPLIVRAEIESALVFESMSTMPPLLNLANYLNLSIILQMALKLKRTSITIIMFFNIKNATNIDVN